MFSKSLERVKELEDTVTRLSAASAGTDQSILAQTRSAIELYIKLKGEEEYPIDLTRPEDYRIRKALIRHSKTYTNTFIENKIRYVETLLSMIPDDNILRFYNDLRSGLDHVISKWDASELDPKPLNYAYSPQRVKKILKYKVIKWKLS